MAGMGGGQEKEQGREDALSELISCPVRLHFNRKGKLRREKEQSTGANPSSERRRCVGRGGPGISKKRGDTKISARLLLPAT